MLVWFSKASGLFEAIDDEEYSGGLVHLWHEFEFIHPFADGNGRTGRLWQSLILQRWKDFFAWMPIETLIYAKQEGYYKALNASNTAGESTIFVTFMLEVIRDALKDVVD